MQVAVAGTATRDRGSLLPLHRRSFSQIDIAIPLMHFTTAPE